MVVASGDVKMSIATGDLARCRAALSRIFSDPESGRTRAVVFGLGSFGDAIQITPLLAALRQRFTGARLILVHPSGLAPELFEHWADLDDVVVAPSSGFPWMRSELLRAAGADLIVKCRYVVEYHLPESSRLGEQDRQFVQSAQLAQQPWLPLVADFPFDNDRLWRLAAQRGMNMYSLMAATGGFAGSDFENLSTALVAEDYALHRELPEKYFVVCNSAEALTIGRTVWTKALPAAKMSRIVAKLKRFQVPSVLLGSKDDPMIDGVDIDWRGRSSLRQAAAILKGARCLLGPEGGLVNLARAVGTRSVVFFGSTPPEFFAFRENTNISPEFCGGCWWTTPSYLYQCPRLLLQPECTRSIPEDDVVQAVRRLLS